MAACTAADRGLSGMGAGFDAGLLLKAMTAGSPGSPRLTSP
jgi:hypothetical protein